MKSKGKPKWPPTNGGDDDQTDRLLKIIDVQSRVIEALALAVGAVSKDGDEDEDDKEGEEE